MTAHGRCVWIAAGIIWLFALYLASHWDLSISVRFADKQALFAIWVQKYGEWPAWLVVLASLVVICLGKERHPCLVRLRPLAAAILVLALVHPLVITQGLKFFWGRIRFRDLGSGYSGYTPFYLPAGIGTGLSFPSGHVAMAFVISPIFFYFQRARNRLLATLSLFVILLYGVSVFWGRILAGAHYLTDCLFSAGLSFLLAYPSIRFGYRVKPAEKDQLSGTTR